MVQAESFGSDPEGPADILFLNEKPFGSVEVLQGGVANGVCSASARLS